MKELTKGLICDEMLQGVGRWLRAAGYDVWIAERGLSDRQLVNLARDSDRLLITRDRRLNNENNLAGVSYLLLESNAMPECLAELTAALGINWLRAPFSRCLICNTPLQLATESQMARVPGDARRFGDVILYCAGCDRVYWQGSHVRRMRHKLESYAKGEWM
ncbi:MAG: hypothetical protein HY272_05010 [Gammaproteobacteria bacterium]|nr:hypothetical protein [Gammaproteobacteria bacterium]